MPEFDEKELLTRLEELEKKALWYFAAACAERLFPAYEQYSFSSQVGSSSEVRAALDLIWEGQPDPTEFSHHLQTLLRLIPDTDEYTSILDAFADDAVSAAAYTLRTAVNSESQDAVYAARRVYEALDYLRVTIAKEDTLVAINDAEGISNQLVQQEISRQFRDIAELMNLDRGTEKVLAAYLKERSQREEAIPRYILHSIRG